MAVLRSLVCTAEARLSYRSVLSYVFGAESLPRGLPVSCIVTNADSVLLGLKLGNRANRAEDFYFVVSSFFSCGHL